jgi:hypothetical protein
VDIYIACILSGFGGGVFSASLAKWFIQKFTQRALESFDTISKKIIEIDTRLAVLVSNLDSKIELLSKHDSMIHEHDRKIVALEARYGEHKRSK